MSCLPSLRGPAARPTCCRLPHRPRPEQLILRPLVILRAMTGTPYSGALLAESLRPNAVLDGIPLTVTKIYRAALGNAEAGQPELDGHRFEVPADGARGLAEALSRCSSKAAGTATSARRMRCSSYSAAASSATRAGTTSAGQGGGIRPLRRGPGSPARLARSGIQNLRPDHHETSDQDSDVPNAAEYMCGSTAGAPHRSGQRRGDNPVTRMPVPGEVRWLDVCFLPSYSDDGC